MIKNYFKIAWRNLMRNKTFSIINITGLAAGLACFILIALYVADELSYDRYNEKPNRIFRINSDIVFGGNKLHMATSSDPMGAVLKKDYPQVEEYVRFFDPMNVKRIKKGNEYIRETNTVYADSTLFNVFTLPVVAGNAKTALNDPNTVVLSESAAKKYFNTTNAVGKSILTGDGPNDIFKVTAVIKDIPHNSHFNFDFIFSMKSVTDYPWNSYLSHNFQTYIVLTPGVDYKQFKKNLDEVVDRYVLPQAKQYMNINSMDEFKKAGNSIEYTLMPLTDIHLKSDRRAEMGVNGNIQYVYIFSAVAFFVLLLACINFMNLSTARSANRAKEVGIRKVLGTEQKSLIQQFLTESTLMSYLSLVLALLIVWICLPYFNQLAAKQLTMQNMLQVKYLVFLLAIPLLVGLIAGVYPAFYLSSFNPIKVLKGRFGTGFKKSNLRNSLVVFQFAATIILIIGTIVVYRQLNFIQTKQLGYNRDQVLIVRGTMALGNNKDAFKNEVSKLSGVVGSTYAGYLPVSNSSRSDNAYSTNAVMSATNSLNLQTWMVDDNYIPVMGMQVIAGRNFSKDFPSDSNAIVINETAAKLIGYKKPVGEKLYTFSDNLPGNGMISYNIVGVVKNFNFESLKEDVGPLLFKYGKSDWTVAFKVNTSNVKNLVASVENKWKTLAPGQPFVYNFMDEFFDEMYRVEQRTGQLGLTFAVIAILIACLGLFGLATYMAEQRIKEIGVRKVLGASVANITTMLSKDFIKLVLIASVIAFPIGWWAMRQWLQDFAYRIDISWWIFGLAILIALLIAILTVSSQAIKAALANPVKSLRTE